MRRRYPARHRSPNNSLAPIIVRAAAFPFENTTVPFEGYKRDPRRHLAKRSRALLNFEIRQSFPKLLRKKRESTDAAGSIATESLRLQRIVDRNFREKGTVPPHPVRRLSIQHLPYLGASRVGAGKNTSLFVQFGMQRRGVARCSATKQPVASTHHRRYADVQFQEKIREEY
jgi:hypothetical protein